MGHPHNESQCAIAGGDCSMPLVRAACWESGTCGCQLPAILSIPSRKNALASKNKSTRLGWLGKLQVGAHLARNSHLLPIQGACHENVSRHIRGCPLKTPAQTPPGRHRARRRRAGRNEGRHGARQRPVDGWRPEPIGGPPGVSIQISAKGPGSERPDVHLSPKEAYKMGWIFQGSQGV